MTLAAPKISGASSPTAKLVQRLRNRLHELGLNFQVWDSQARPASHGTTGTPVCEAMMGASEACHEALADAACRTLAQKAPITCIGPCGGCILGVPVLRRRRVLGAVTVCFPCRETLEDGTLAGHWKRLGLDPHSLPPVAAASARHSRRQAADFLKLLCWLIESEEDAEVARTETETLSANLANTYEELSLLYQISGSMKVNQSPADFFRGICANLVEVMHISGSTAVVLAAPGSGGESVVVQAGETGLSDEQVLAMALGQISRRFANHRPMVENDFHGEGPGAAGIAKLIAAPLTSEDALTGMLLGFNKAHGDFDSVDLKLISSIANQAAVFVSNNRLYAEVQDLLMGVLHALTASIDAKDPYTSGHSARVAVISRKIAERMGLSAAKVQQIYLAGLLHDVGKIGVPEVVLRKPGRLTEEEFQLVQAHPAIGARILGGIRQLDDVIGGIYSHHERLDGKGYPQGLQGDQVPQDGLIVGLADAFDAMTSERTYRKALPLDNALAELRRCSGVQFHPAVVEAFLSLNMDSLVEELHQPASTVFPAAGQEEEAE